MGSQLMIWSWMNLCNRIVKMYMWTTVKTTCQSGNEREEMDADDELNTLMHFVFGSGSGNNLSLE